MRRWKTKPCGCVKANLAHAGKVAIRCPEHRGKPSKRALAYFDKDGIARWET